MLSHDIFNQLFEHGSFTNMLAVLLMIQCCTQDPSLSVNVTNVVDFVEAKNSWA